MYSSLQIHNQRCCFKLCLVRGKRLLLRLHQNLVRYRARRESPKDLHIREIWRALRLRWSLYGSWNARLLECGKCKR